MPAVLTHKAITLLARDRLKRLQSAMERTIDRKTLLTEPVSTLERKIARLAEQAIDILSAPPLADARSIAERQDLIGTAPELYRSVSRFAVMGSMGPDLPAFGHMFDPGQGWIFDTVHKGNPDYNREAVIARTTDLALAFNRRATSMVRDRYRDSDPVKQEDNFRRELRKVRAYALGHLCHVAADVVSHPFINDLEWHAAIPGSKHIAHGDNEKIIDADVAAKVFRRVRLKGGQGWSEWWPEHSDLEEYFFEAYAEAFEDVYGTGRPQSFKDFEDELEALDAPGLTPDFMKDSYGTFRGFVLNFAYSWGMWEWFAALTPLMAPLIFTPLIGQGLPHGRELFGPEDGDFDLSERGHFELLTLPMGAGGLAALILSALMVPFARNGASDTSVYSVVTQSFGVASWLTALIEGIATKEADGEGIPDGARWMFFFIAPMVLNLALLGPLLQDALDDYDHPRPFGEKPRHRRILLSLPFALPLVALLLVGVLVAIYAALRKSKDTGIGDTAFLVTMALWMVVIIGLWFLGAYLVNLIGLPEKAKGDEAPLQRHGVALFDDQTLHADPTLATDVYYYPSDLRPLARLWWDGDGEMEIRSDRYGLTFRHSAAAETQTVPGPMVPMTMAEYLAFLEETVADGAGTTGGLKGAIFDAEEIANYPLPTGAVFAGHGDFERHPKEEDVNEELAEFKELGETDDDDAYMLYHAAKPQQAAHLTPKGPFIAGSEAEWRAAGSADGYRYVVDLASEDADRSEALMAQAADLAALMCIGAAGRMQDNPLPEDRVYQVFRNWSLDRRRVNEWRTLVMGQARSDKDDDGTYDPAMPQGDDGPDNTATWAAPLAGAADAGALTEGADTARGYGWIPVLREFSRLVEEGLNLHSTDTDPVRPDVPAPRAITRAMAYLVDAPDPEEV